MEDKDRATNFLKKVHPQDNANFISKLFFLWPLPIFVKGFRKDLTEDDLYGPIKSHLSNGLGDKLEGYWEAEKNSHRTPSLWRAIAKMFWKWTVLSGLLFLTSELFIKTAQPLLVGLVMSYYVPNQTTVSKTEAYLYALALVFTSFLNVLLNNILILGLQEVGMKIRISTCSLIYRKALKLSKSAMADTTVGQTVNLMSNDVNKFNFLLVLIHHLWLAPIEIVIILYLLYINLDASAMVGAVLLIAFVPLQRKMTSKYRMQTALKTDQRVRLMNEIINGIQVIKMYTWEKSFAKLVAKARKLEIHQIKAASYLRAINFSFMMFLNRTSVYLCIVTYVLTGNTLQAQYVYVLASFYNHLRAAVTVFLPLGITMLAEANVSVKRIQTFLAYDEIGTPERTEQILRNHSNGKEKSLTNGSLLPLVPKHTDIGITAQDLSIKWSTSQDCTLTKINFEAKSGQLTAIVGTVGSGKSTLFHAFLKELEPVEGSLLDIKGRISYASQEPWLFAASIKQNILFGQEMNQTKYNEVVKACALERDFNMFPYGDRTIVGERGVMLSGGQKARINLARAIYKDADIYLLDDPLSAVDAHVGKQLFDDCVVKFLKDKCVILITHQLQYLRSVEKIYFMDDGSVKASGSYNELQQSNQDFFKLLQDEHDDDDIDSKVDGTSGNGHKSDLPSEIKEQRGRGTIRSKIYSKYLSAGGGWGVYSILLGFFIVCQLAVTAIDYFISFWTNLEQVREEQKFNDKLLNNTADVAISAVINERASNSTESLMVYLSTIITPEICIYIHSALIATIIVMSLTRSLSFFKFAMTSSTNLHKNMFSKISHATMRFFNTNPSGRILNRFSKDMGAIDEILPQSIIDTTQIALNVLGISLLISSVTPWILLPTVVMFAIFYLYRVVYLATSRDLKRMEGTTRSPVFSQITASLQGLTTIRAFGAQDILMKEFDQHQDLNSSAFYLFLACNRAFGFWLDMNCVIYTGLVTTSFLFIGTETYGGNVGLAITQAISLSNMLQHGMRQWSELENQMTAVERVIEYTELDPEEDNGRQVPSELWPDQGHIQFKELSLRYCADDPYVLKKLTFSIEANEKVGIVGRTGAGKSSLIFALFRLTPIEGAIVIDNIDTSHIPLDHLRSKISIIPQEPVLFSGTLRKNLDPFDEYDDPQLWKALEAVEMRDVVADLPQGIQSTVSEGGSNFSVGQRQLLCLARAVIRSNKILIMDEATANVDPQTDELIQRTIRRKFQNCTVLTIAHRLHTVMDSDKILVMDAGCAVQFDHPYQLLQQPEGKFYELVKQTGKGMADNLMEIARNSYHTH